jgi:hypothetical protein
MTNERRRERSKSETVLYFRPFPTELKRRFRLYAVGRGESMRTIVIKLIEEELRKNEKK